MPRQPQWYLRVPSALAALADFPAPVVDRSALEDLLGIGRRDAIRLMHRLGAYQCGRTFVVEREELRQRLEALARGDRWQWEQRRRSRVGEHLAEAQRSWKTRRIAIPAEAPRQPPNSGISPAIRLTPGRLEIEFTGAVDLLARLLELTRAMGDDYEGFERLLGS